MTKRIQVNEIHPSPDQLDYIINDLGLQLDIDEDLNISIPEGQLGALQEALAMGAA